VSEAQVKTQLKKALRSLTPGSVLSLLAEVYRDMAEKARQDNDQTSYRQCRMAENTLIVVGLGIDAIYPR
jgi:hypothetical protein